MKNRKKDSSVKLGIVVALLFLTVGFAAVSTVLYVNGTITFGENNENFDKNIRFSKQESKEAKIEDSTGAVGGTVSVSENGKTLEFETPVLNNLGQEVTVSYHIENRSQYDALLGELTCNVTKIGDTSVDWNEYITITPSNKYNGLELKSDSVTSEPDTIVVKLIKSYMGEDAAFKAECQMTATGINN